MNDNHAWHANNSLHVGLMKDDSHYQAVGRLDRTPSMIVVNIKEIMMHADGYTTVWRTHIEVGRSGQVNGWYQQLGAWWTTHKAARLEVRCASPNACWVTAREMLALHRAEAALEMANTQGAFSMATHPYSLIR
jgi:hypothetical protein